MKFLKFIWKYKSTFGIILLVIIIIIVCIILGAKFYQLISVFCAGLIGGGIGIINDKKLEKIRKDRIHDEKYIDSLTPDDFDDKGRIK